MRGVFGCKLTSPGVPITVGNDRLNQIMGSQSGRHRHKATAAQEGYGTGSVLPERGIYLTSAVYRPVLQVCLDFNPLPSDTSSEPECGVPNRKLSLMLIRTSNRLCTLAVFNNSKFAVTLMEPMHVLFNVLLEDVSNVGYVSLLSCHLSFTVGSKSVEAKEGRNEKVKRKGIRN